MEPHSPVRCSRIDGSFVGTQARMLLFLGSFPLLWWNEGKAVQTERSLEEGPKVVVAADADPAAAPADFCLAMLNRNEFLYVP